MLNGILPGRPPRELALREPTLGRPESEKKITRKRCGPTHVIVSTMFRDSEFQAHDMSGKKGMNKPGIQRP
jgi:hypothetical protein